MPTASWQKIDRPQIEPMQYNKHTPNTILANKLFCKIS